MVSSRRWFAIGDPQTTFERFRGILGHHGLLDAAGNLRDEVGLVSMGDHFDFDHGKHDRTLEASGREGTQILSWLAQHAPEQVVILMGNHDVARVMELAFESDASFAEARAMAKSAPEAFFDAFPRIPKPDIALRDYASFAVHQRDLVQRLLLERRMLLAAVGYRDGRPLLMTHAGVTTGQIDQLGASSEPRAIADALQRHLAKAVELVAANWRNGELVALDLRPLHVGGTSRQEGGGLLYQRVSRREDASGRRFHPHALPRGLAQVWGHTGHHKCKEELEDAWIADDARARPRGGLRTLAVDASGIRYTARVEPAREDAATVYMIDIEMSRPEVTDLPLLELDAVEHGALP